MWRNRSQIYSQCETSSGYFLIFLEYMAPSGVQSQKRSCQWTVVRKSYDSRKISYRNFSSHTVVRNFANFSLTFHDNLSYRISRYRQFYRNRKFLTTAHRTSDLGENLLLNGMHATTQVLVSLSVSELRHAAHVTR